MHTDYKQAAMKQNLNKKTELSDHIAAANDLYISILGVLFFGDIFCPITSKSIKYITA